jgi:hypothetical protein
MMGAVAIMGMAVQARILIVLQARLREITAEQEKKMRRSKPKPPNGLRISTERLKNGKRNMGDYSGWSLPASCRISRQAQLL